MGKNLAKATLCRGRSYYKQEKYELAITDLTVVLDSRDDAGQPLLKRRLRTDLFTQRGRAYAKMGRMELARADFEASHELNEEA